MDGISSAFLASILSVVSFGLFGLYTWWLCNHLSDAREDPRRVHERCARFIIVTFVLFAAVLGATLSMIVPLAECYWFLMFGSSGLIGVLGWKIRRARKTVNATC